jgi:hypothetical protein
MSTNDFVFITRAAPTDAGFMKAFKDNAAERAANGLGAIKTLRCLAEDGKENIGMYCAVSDVAKAKEYMESPELLAKIEAAGGKAPKCVWMTGLEMEDSYEHYTDAEYVTVKFAVKEFDSWIVTYTKMAAHRVEMKQQLCRVHKWEAAGGQGCFCLYALPVAAEMLARCATPEVIKAFDDMGVIMENAESVELLGWKPITSL